MFPSVDLGWGAAKGGLFPGLSPLPLMAHTSLKPLLPRGSRAHGPNFWRTFRTEGTRGLRTDQVEVLGDLRVDVAGGGEGVAHPGQGWGWCVCVGRYPGSCLPPSPPRKAGLGLASHCPSPICSAAAHWPPSRHTTGPLHMPVSLSRTHFPTRLTLQLCSPQRAFPSPLVLCLPPWQIFSLGSRLLDSGIGFVLRRTSPESGSSTVHGTAVSPAPRTQ